MKTQIEALIETAISRLPGIDAAGDAELKPELERTRDRQHGDYACNIAMRLAKPMRNKPRDIAGQIVDLLPESGLIEKVEIAGPGFINFHLTAAALHGELTSILERGERYGHGDLGAGRKILLEYVSANPTGPLHVGHGRHAAYGATVANLLKATGHEVHEEYYVNDAGRQMDILALSVWIRMLQAGGIKVELPSNGYRGQYIPDIAEMAANDQVAARIIVERIDGLLVRNVELVLADVDTPGEQLIQYAVAKLHKMFDHIQITWGFFPE